MASEGSGFFFLSAQQNQLWDSPGTLSPELSSRSMKLTIRFPLEPRLECLGPYLYAFMAYC